jgi:chromosomal replication initiation ATPase DnaA
MDDEFQTEEEREQAAERKLADEREKAEDRRLARFACALVAHASGLDPWQVEHRRGRSTEVTVRHVAMYLCHIVYGMTLQRVASAFRRHTSTVSFACHRIEDRREDKMFDAWFEALESSLRAAPITRLPLKRAA